jgi:hypothetical protein
MDVTQSNSVFSRFCLKHAPEYGASQGWKGYRVYADCGSAVCVYIVGLCFSTKFVELTRTIDMLDK